MYCEIVPFDATWEALAPRRPAALILSGGPESTLVDGAPQIDPAILAAGVPVLGICYGMQLIARDAGAHVVKLDHAEYGPATLQVEDRSTPLFRRSARQSAGVDVARRFGARTAGGVSHVSRDDALPCGFDGQRSAQGVRRAVSS